MKLSLILLLSCFILGQNVISTEAQAKNHTVFWGVRSFRDVHLHREVVFKPSSWFRKVTGDYTWEQKVGVAAKKK